MKKVLFPLIVLAVMASQAWAAPCLVGGEKIFCQWSADGCWGLSDSDNEGVFKGCDVQAGSCPALYKGGGEGRGACTSFGNNQPWTCDGCVYDGAAPTVFCDYGDKKYNDAGEVIDGGCFEKLASEGCVGGFVCTQSDCSDSPRLNGGVKYCDYGEANQYGEGGCWAITNEEEQASCDANGEEVSVCPGSVNAIVNLNIPVTSNVLAAMHNAVNLQVTTGAATLSIYDMKGKVVRTQKIGQSGSFNVQLQLPRGLYIVQATSGSWKQTVKVTVK
jgi:hypothetical protein